MAARPIHCLLTCFLRHRFLPDCSIRWSPASGRCTTESGAVRLLSAIPTSGGVSPALTPLVIDPAHPFPFLSNLSTSLVFLLHNPARAERMYARIKVPAVGRPWIPLQADVEPGHTLLVALHDVIRGNADKLYRGMALSAPTVVRLTRDAEVAIDDDSDAAVSQLVQEQIRQRRYEPVVRLEFAPNADAAIRELLRTRFELLSVDIYDVPDEVDYTTLFEIAGLPLPELLGSHLEPACAARVGRRPHRHLYRHPGQ